MSQPADRPLPPRILDCTYDTDELTSSRRPAPTALEGLLG
jgi:hypothetical protein